MSEQYETNSEATAGSSSMGRQNADGRASMYSSITPIPDESDCVFAPLPGGKDHYQWFGSQQLTNTPTSGDPPSSASDTQYSYGEPGSTSNAFSSNFGISPTNVPPTPSSLRWAHNTELLMLYQFVVPKSKEPYFELIDKFTPTYETPSKVYLDEPSGFKRGQFPCMYPGGCTGKMNVFGRPADLERHYKNVHADIDDKWPCDYPKCPRARDPFRRKDHYRDHLRDYHKEDIGSVKKGKDWNDRRFAQERASWLAERKIDAKYWRCAHCLIKNIVEDVGWQCSSCKGPCQDDRIEARQGSASKDAGGTDSLASLRSGYSTCAECSGDGWIDDGFGIYRKCASCQEEDRYAYYGTSQYGDNPGYTFNVS